MSRRDLLQTVLLGLLAVASLGCRAPGHPRPGPEIVRPDQVLDFPTLYKQNCSACHGANGKNGAAISLANPVYLVVAGAPTLTAVTANGVKGTLMPPFAKSAGGMLTDQQIGVLVQGMLQQWGHPDQLSGLTPPAYASSASGDPARGQIAFATFCAQCHGADGTGATSTIAHRQVKIGSIVDPSYLALVSDQDLRSTIIAGRPDEGMPDWRSDVTGTALHTMADQEITDTVAWLAAHRVKTAGQPYPEHP